jgi:acetoin utilization deacetylase AcuC-like enzyme
VKVVHSPLHARHDGGKELHRGELVPCFEMPVRADYTLPCGTGWKEYSAALEAALDVVGGFSPEALVVSLGVDTYEGDPISAFKLATQHSPLMGRRLAELRLPTVFVQEGGYAVEEIGTNVAGVLEGFSRGGA